MAIITIINAKRPTPTVTHKVASSIRNYGQLRTIGTTKRQIKKMVYREGKLLAAIAIPIGLVIGNVIGYFLIPAGWYWLTTLCVTVGVGLFATPS